MRKRVILALALSIALVVLAPSAVAEAMTYSKHIIRTSTTSKGFVRASGPWAAWSEADVEWLNDSESSIIGPSRVFLYDTRTQTIVDVDPGTDQHPGYDVGPGFVVYLSAPVLPGPMAVELYDIASGAPSVLATGIDSVAHQCAPACGESFVAWADDLLHVYDVRAAVETTYAVSSGYHSLAADGENIAWIEPSGESGLPASLHWLSTRTGAHRQTAIPSFSPIACSISPAGVLVEGEEPAYRSALYLWDPATGLSRKLVGVEDSYHSVFGSRASTRYVAWSQRSSKEYPNYRIAVMDLSSGAWELLYPYLNAAIAGEFDGSRLWFTQATTTNPVTDSYASIGYVDITPTSEPSSGTGGTSSGAWTSSDEAIAETASVDASVTLPATETPAPAAGGQPAATEAITVESPVGSGALLPVLAALGGLTLVGGGAWLVRRRHA